MTAEPDPSQSKDSKLSAAEKRLRDVLAQLQAANEELDSFCYSVSHDLRAPLRSIRGFNEVLLERYAQHLDARGQEFLRRACDAGHHMDELVESLLKLSRVGRTQLVRQEVDLSQIANSVAEELSAGAASRQVKFSIASGIRVTGDERLLHIVMDNLLRNAWKFTARRADALIEIGRETGPERPVYVRDNGAGFDPAYAERLFGVFQRLHSESDFAGTGVGLAIVKRIIRRHGGRVWAVGEIDRGATFYFSLPTNEIS